MSLRVVPIEDEILTIMKSCLLMLLSRCFSISGTFYLVFVSNPSVTWRGIRYTVRKGGFIEAAYEENGYEEFEENKLNV